MSTRHTTFVAAATFLATASSFPLAGCKPDQTSTQATQPSSSASASHLPTTRMSIGNQTFNLEIAYRPEDHGMIFVFPAERNLNFWMKNTLIPLDIVYLDRAGRVVSVKHMKPLDETNVPSDGPAMYAIELNAGTAERVGVKAGDTVKLPDELRVP